jgi:pyruvate formate lyase activating enzyme
MAEGMPICQLERQGLRRGSCEVRRGKHVAPACALTLRMHNGKLERLIKSMHLSRPENYFSIYQSGCNFSCRKCHSWEFSQRADGNWYSVDDLVRECQDYERHVTLEEPRERATAWHASQTCRCCGACVLGRRRGPSCPGVLSAEQVVLSPQGFGPARNIVAFTGGDVTCNPEFYCEFARLVKERTRLWVLIETNGYGLTSRNLDMLAEAGVDAFWLDIKAYHDRVHVWLTGTSNAEILKLPQAMMERGFVLEVLSLYIPGLVETDQLREIARLIAATDSHIPFTILAFFPEYRMHGYRSPTTHEMLAAYKACKSAGLEQIKLGNLGIFIRDEGDQELLQRELGGEAL